MNNKMKSLILIVGLITGVMATAIMSTSTQTVSSIDISPTHDGTMIKQLVLQKGTHLIIQATHKLLQTN